MNWIITIFYSIIYCMYCVLKYIILSPFYIYVLCEGLIEGFRNRSLPQRIIEKFQNYDNLTEEEKFNGDYVIGEELKEKYYDALSEIVKSWFDKKILDEDRCRFIEETVLESSELLGILINDIEKLPFSQKDYKQLISIYKYINSNRPYWDDYQYTLECAEYIRRYWNESGAKPLPLTNTVNVDLNFSKMATLSLKEMQELKEKKQEPVTKELCFYITERLNLFPQKSNECFSVKLSLFADRLEIYKCNKNDILDENGNVILKKGENDIIKLEEIDDIKFNDWKKIIASREKSEPLEDKGPNEFLFEIFCNDGRKYSFSDAREPDILIIRALLLYFIQKSNI